jgi:hypothetical protein
MANSVIHLRFGFGISFDIRISELGLFAVRPALEREFVQDCPEVICVYLCSFVVSPPPNAKNGIHFAKLWRGGV